MTSASTDDAVLIAEGLGKAYGAQRALRGFSVRVQPGELVGLIGQNGAGKTTALSMLSGQLVPTEGRVLLAGHDLFASPVEARRALGYVAQDLLLPPHLTIDELARFACEVKRCTLSAPELDQLLEHADLVGDRQRLVGELSHGQQRKAAWVVALVSQPRLLLLDEGLAGLDAASARALVDEIVSRVKRARIGVLWAEHDLQLLAPHLTRVLLLGRGELREALDGAAIRTALAEGTLDEQQARWVRAKT